MKFSVTVQDLTADEARSIIERLDVPTFVINQGAPKAPAAPSAPPIPQAPSAPAAPVANVTVKGIDLDSSGLPFDERIHAGSKTKNKDGTWKKRKGVQPVEISNVEAELRSRVGASAPAAPSAPQAPAAFAPPPAAPVAVPSAPAPVATPSRDFQGLMLRISQLFQGQQITPEYPTTIVQRVNQGFGVTLNTITDVANDPRMVEYAWQCLEVDKKAA